MEASIALPATTLHAAATGVELATPGTPASFTLPAGRRLRNGLLLFRSTAGGTTTAPSIMVRRDSVFYKVGDVVEGGGNLVLAAGQGFAVPVRDLLTWGDGIWIKSSTITGDLTVEYVPLETHEE